MTTARPILIAGGGIGGLTAAIALGRESLDCQVLDRGTFAEESGAGIQLGPNATRILAKLDALDAIVPAAFEPQAIRLFDGLNAKALATVSLGATARTRYGAPYLTIHRTDLHAGLHAVAESRTPVTLTPGFGVASITTEADAVAVTSVDGAKVDGASLIGADGLWSTVRETIAPGAALVFSGATAFRTVLPRGALPAPFAGPDVGLWLGPGAHLVHYPVRGGEALNVVAIVTGGTEAQGWNRPADLEALQSGFTRWCKESKSLLEQPAQWRAWSLFSLAPLPSWSRGAVTLLGDAAHPVLPYLAQGGGLAIEDAQDLAQSLARAPDDPASAFRSYETRRRPRAKRLQQAAHRMGGVYHMQGPFRLARNLVLRRRAPEALLRQFDWLYSGV